MHLHGGGTIYPEDCISEPVKQLRELLDSKPKYLTKNNELGKALSVSVQRGKFKETKAILDKIVELNVKQEIEYSTSGLTTPLIFAAFFDRIETLQLLINFEANVDARNMAGWGAIHCAAEHPSRYPMLDVLLQANADVNLEISSGYVKRRRTALYMLVKAGNMERIKQVIAAGADVNYITGQGFTVLHCAAYQGHIEVFEYLKTIEGIDETIRTPPPYKETAQMTLEKYLEKHQYDQPGVDEGESKHDYADAPSATNNTKYDDSPFIKLNRRILDGDEMSVQSTATDATGYLSSRTRTSEGRGEVNPTHYGDVVYWKRGFSGSINSKGKEYDFYKRHIDKNSGPIAVGVTVSFVIGYSQRGRGKEEAHNVCAQ